MRFVDLLPPRFLNWRLIDGRKVPVNLAGAPCDAHNPVNHLTHVVAAATGMGVAFDVRAEDGMFFLDLDKCHVNGAWTAEAVAIFTSFNGAWGEVSQSGTGLHIMGYCDTAALKDRRSKWDGWKEFYTDGRFVAFGSTGWEPIGGTATGQDWTAQLLKVVPQREYLGDLPDGTDPTYTGPADDAALIALMLRAKVSAGAAFGMKATLTDLWTGNRDALARQWPQGDSFDHSSADAALLTHLAFWTGKDMPRMDRLFRQSGLMRDKYRDRPDYRTASITTAARLCKRVYDHVAPVAAAVAAVPDVYMTLAEQLVHFAGCVYIRDMHQIMLPDGTMCKPAQFDAMMGGHIFQMQPDGTGTTKGAFEAFTQNRGYKFPKVNRPCFDPRQPGGAIIGDAVNTYFDPKVTKIPGDISRFTGLLEKLLPDAGDRTILLNYMAALVQHPGVKFQWCPVLQGCEGNGKTLVFSCVAQAVGRRYTHEPRAKHLGSNFNAYVEGKVFILIEEIHMAGRRETLDDLKPMITNILIELEGKGSDQRMIENRANFGMCTNYKDAVIKTLGDRRYAIFFTAQQTKVDLSRDGMGGAYFPRLYHWLREEGGYAAIAHYLSTFQIDPALNPAGDCHRAPETSSTIEAIRRTAGTIETDILEATQDNSPGFRAGWISAHAVDDLMKSKNHRVGRNKQIEIVESLGYVQFGRASRAIMQEGFKRPMLFRLPEVTGGFDDFMLAQGYLVR